MNKTLILVNKECQKVEITISEEVAKGVGDQLMMPGVFIKFKDAKGNSIFLDRNMFNAVYLNNEENLGVGAVVRG
jgi:hypothetical protein